MFFTTKVSEPIPPTSMVLAFGLRCWCAPWVRSHTSRLQIDPPFRHRKITWDATGGFLTWLPCKPAPVCPLRGYGRPLETALQVSEQLRLRTVASLWGPRAKISLICCSLGVTWGFDMQLVLKSPFPGPPCTLPTLRARSLKNLGPLPNNLDFCGF